MSVRTAQPGSPLNNSNADHFERTIRVRRYPTGIRENDQNAFALATCPEELQGTLAGTGLTPCAAEQMKGCTFCRRGLFGNREAFLIRTLSSAGYPAGNPLFRFILCFY